jgi:hypothetical protein
MIGYSRREFLAASASIVVNAGWLGSPLELHAMLVGEWS